MLAKVTEDKMTLILWPTMGEKTLVSPLR